MCKYCKLTEISEKEFRNEMNLDPIICIKDGSQRMNMYFNRYIAESDKIRRANMELNLEVVLDDEIYSVKSKQIKIKYCPFCGEKLV